MQSTQSKYSEQTPAPSAKKRITFSGVPSDSDDHSPTAQRCERADAFSNNGAIAKKSNHLDLASTPSPATKRDLVTEMPGSSYPDYVHCTPTIQRNGRYRYSAYSPSRLQNRQNSNVLTRRLPLCLLLSFFVRSVLAYFLDFDAHNVLYLHPAKGLIRGSCPLLCRGASIGIQSARYFAFFSIEEEAELLHKSGCHTVRGKAIFSQGRPISDYQT